MTFIAVSFGSRFQYLLPTLHVDVQLILKWLNVISKCCIVRNCVCPKVSLKMFPRWNERGLTKITNFVNYERDAFYPFTIHISLGPVLYYSSLLMRYLLVSTDSSTERPRRHARKDPSTGSRSLQARTVPTTGSHIHCSGRDGRDRCTGSGRTNTLWRTQCSSYPCTEHGYIGPHNSTLAYLFRRILLFRQNHNTEPRTGRRRDRRWRPARQHRYPLPRSVEAEWRLPSLWHRYDRTREGMSAAGAGQFQNHGLHSAHTSHQLPGHTVPNTQQPGCATFHFRTWWVTLNDCGVFINGITKSRELETPLYLVSLQTWRQFYLKAHGRSEIDKNSTGQWG